MGKGKSTNLTGNKNNSKEKDPNKTKPKAKVEWWKIPQNPEPLITMIDILNQHRNDVRDAPPVTPQLDYEKVNLKQTESNPQIGPWYNSEWKVKSKKKNNS